MAEKIAQRISIDADRPTADFENEVLERFFCQGAFLLGYFRLNSSILMIFPLFGLGW